MKTKSFLASLQNAALFADSKSLNGVWSGMAFHGNSLITSDGFCAANLVLEEDSGINGVVEVAPFLKILNSVSTEDLEISQTSEDALSLKAGSFKAEFPIRAFDKYPAIDKSFSVDFEESTEVSNFFDAIPYCLWPEIVKSQGLLGSLVCRQKDDQAVLYTCDGKRIVYTSMNQKLPSEQFLVPASIFSSSLLSFLSKHAQALKIVENEQKQSLAVKLDIGEVLIPTSLDNFNSYPTDTVEAHLSDLRGKRSEICSLSVSDELVEAIKRFSNLEKLDDFRTSGFSLSFQDGKVVFMLKNTIIGEVCDSLDYEKSEELTEMEGLILRAPADQLFSFIKNAKEIRFNKNKPDKIYFVGKDNEKDIGIEMLVACIVKGD